jgi:hypothetical protein
MALERGRAAPEGELIAQVLEVIAEQCAEAGRARAAVAARRESVTQRTQRWIERLDERETVADGVSVWLTSVSLPAARPTAPGRRPTTEGASSNG